MVQPGARAVIPAIVAAVHRTTLAPARDAVSGEATAAPVEPPIRDRRGGRSRARRAGAGVDGGDGSCGARTEALLEELLGGKTRVLLTPSCTAALEMAAMLIGVGAAAR